MSRSVDFHGIERVERESRRTVASIPWKGKRFRWRTGRRRGQYRYSVNHGLSISIIETICRRWCGIMTRDSSSERADPGVSRCPPREITAKLFMSVTYSWLYIARLMWFFIYTRSLFGQLLTFSMRQRRSCMRSERVIADATQASNDNV